MITNLDKYAREYRAKVLQYVCKKRINIGKKSILSDKYFNIKLTCNKTLDSYNKEVLKYDKYNNIITDFYFKYLNFMICMNFKGLNK